MALPQDIQVICDQPSLTRKMFFTAQKKDVWEDLVEKGGYVIYYTREDELIGIKVISPIGSEHTTTAYEYINKSCDAVLKDAIARDMKKQEYHYVAQGVMNEMKKSEIKLYAQLSALITLLQSTTSFTPSVYDRLQKKIIEIIQNIQSEIQNNISSHHIGVVSAYLFEKLAHHKMGA